MVVRTDNLKGMRYDCWQFAIGATTCSRCRAPARFRLTRLISGRDFMVVVVVDEVLGGVDAAPECWCGNS
jgi:hypothetical protein